MAAVATVKSAQIPKAHDWRHISTAPKIPMPPRVYNHVNCRYRMALALIDLAFAVGSVASEGMDSSRSSYHFTTVCYASWNEIFLSSF